MKSNKMMLNCVILMIVLLVSILVLSTQVGLAQDPKYTIRVAFMDPPDPTRQPTAAFWEVFKK